jgi:pimeloyl-ACP methyl ester carboxylesterase
MTAAFGGEDQLNWWSPALWKINARVLWGVAANDWYVPYAQGTELRDKMLGNDPAAYIDVQKLDAGTTPWVHNSVSDAALQSFYAAEDKLVAPLVGA